MTEAKSGVVRVKGVTLRSLKGFLEWMYLGRAGEECKEADGRELWLLAEMYGVGELQRWLLEGIDDGNVCAAYEFGLIPEGDRSELLKLCRTVAVRGLGGVGENNL
eukprot:CAMPEP_0173414430 /NCGR_PEP_ID=MMETSP1356-20130122/84323_1 /TAXON_ID=77927 ORGANISM="Hemiselmis virescens, Strain PCC157" /NCGR_SAMPLE_ID=MMETSP1356 /ASSEMBLY_ACC=CAM_ASM_000847 /LENGTH=105 /DNA_ID=CAMNT_0014376613 /DNA_START=2341 /DNA_END=2654 /DNA_ORIENTATION=-